MRSSIFKGVLATILMLLVYVTTLSLVSGREFMLLQLQKYWYFVLPLAAGFGIQVGLYTFLRESMKHTVSRKMVATTGLTSTAAMVSCCAHYLVNFLPILGVVGAVTLISQYQTQLFWVGLAFNLAGIMYMLSQLGRFNLERVKYVLVAVLLVIAGYSLYSLFREPDVKENMPVVQTQNTLLPQTSSEGPVEVEVTPIEVSSSQTSWKFKIVLTTHSEELDQDLTKVVFLTVGENIYKPISWDGPPPGGHHITGILSFGPISSTSDKISITVKEIGEVAERKFVW